jgi:hypothetical protein
MVERQVPGEGKRLEEFTGKVTEVVLEKSTFEDTEQDQYHIVMAPEDIQIKGKTGALHEWVKLSAKATQKSVPEGSIVERYLSQLEVVLPDAKKAKTLSEAFGMMKGKTFKFKRLKLGRPFQGKPAKEMWTPVELVK